MSKIVMFTGCCNRGLSYAPRPAGKGIQSFRLDEETGAAEWLGTIETIDNPTFVAVAPGGRILAAISELEGRNEGLLTSYAIDAATGGLSYLDMQPTRGDTSAHLDFDRTGGFVAAVNYATGPVTQRPNRSFAVYRLGADGEIGARTGEATHHGHGADPQRQERPQAHCVRWSPDNRFVTLVDLGIDRLVTYAFDAATGAIAPQGELVLPPGSGPRHLAFHPTLPFAYLVSELQPSVTGLRYDAAAGRFSILGSAPTVSPGSTVTTFCSGIVVAPGGTHLFAGNRGGNSLARFDIDPATGIAGFAGTIPTGGKTPRDLAFSPSGKMLAVANQDSDQIALFRHDLQSGALTPLATIATGSPTAIAFLAV